jgi:hypothetical protein
MRERDRLEFRRYLEETAEQEREERERIEAPIRAMEAKLKKTHYDLAKVYIARLRGEVADPERFISPEVETIRLTAKQADDYTTSQWKVYSSDHPEIYWGVNGELIDDLARYFEKNGIKIITAEMIARMSEYNLLPERPAPVPIPEPIHETEPQQPVPAGPQTYIGRDWETGQDREFSDREINRMSSEQYARAFPVVKDLREIFCR